MEKESFNFYARPAEIVAKALLGGEIRRKLPTGDLRGIILETGAYQGGNATKSRQGMFYSAGTIFLMPFRGLTSLNIATDKEYFASCIEIRAAEFNGELIETPYKLTKFLSLDYYKPSKNLDGKLLGGEICIKPCKKALPSSQIIISKLSSRSDNCIAYYNVQR
jgi:3-methyladenine DNA glycosylase Mpg